MSNWLSFSHRSSRWISVSRHSILGMVLLLTSNTRSLVNVSSPCKRLVLRSGSYQGILRVVWCHCDSNRSLQVPHMPLNLQDNLWDRKKWRIKPSMQSSLLLWMLSFFSFVNVSTSSIFMIRFLPSHSSSSCVKCAMFSICRMRLKPNSSSLRFGNGVRLSIAVILLDARKRDSKLMDDKDVNGCIERI